MSLSWLGSPIGSILAAVVGFGLLVIVHEAGHFLAARLCGMRVERFSVGFGPVILSKRIGATLYALSALPLGGYVKIAGMGLGETVDPSDRSSYANQSAWRRFLVIAAGPAMSYLAAVVLAFAMLTGSGFPEPDPEAVVGEVLPGSPASRAGLTAGDRVLSASGRPTHSWQALVSEVRANPGRALELRVQRDPGAAPLVIQVMPEVSGGQARLGITPRLILSRAGSTEAALSAVNRSNQQLSAIGSGLGQVITGKQKAEFMGPLGIGAQMAQSARIGLAPFLWTVWLISLTLAFLNLLPLPALDGGRLAFLLYEMVTRHRADQRLENLVHLAGFVALFGLLLIVTLMGDLGRLLH